MATVTAYFHRLPSTLHRFRPAERLKSAGAHQDGSGRNVSSEESRRDDRKRLGIGFYTE